MSVIDLGESHGEVRLDPAPEPGRGTRGLRLVAVLALLLAVAGAMPWPSPLPEASVPARLSALIATGGDRLLVVDPGRDAGVPDSDVAAFRLPGGQPLWRVPLPMTGALKSIAVVGGRLILSGPWGDAWPQETVALDLGTGAVVWRRTTRFVQATVRDDLLFWDDDENGSVSLRLADAATGAIRWSVDFPARTRLSFRYDLDRVSAIVVSLPSDRLELRDVASGQVVRGVELPPPSDPAAEPRWFVEVVGNLLLAYGPRFVTAYGFDRLDRRWTLPIDSAEADPLLTACGPGMCQFGRQGGVGWLDPNTGRIRWSDPRWSDVYPAGNYLLANEPNAIGGSRPLVVLDPGTGRRLGDLGAWLVAGPPGTTRKVIGVRLDTATQTALVAELDPPTLGVRVLGVLRQVSTDCRARPGLILCRRVNGTVGLWRLPA